LDLIKDYFESLKKQFEPGVIFTHNRGDLHQDHRTVNELTWNTFRNHLIFEYEIPKYDGDLGIPNIFCPISSEFMKLKTQRLMKHYVSQHHRQWFTENTFEAMMRLRGIECNSDSGFAEAFYVRKVCIR
jgi:LmbE family N-acetylglucosaminyl deacetylase